MIPILLDFIELQFRDNPVNWCMPVGLLVGAFVLIRTVYKRIRYGYVKKSDILSEDEYNTRYPFGENFVVYFSIPVICAIGTMLLCMGLNSFIKAEVVTVSEGKVETTVYPFFGKGAPTGVGSGKYVVNEGDKPLVLWQVIENGHVAGIKKLIDIPPESVIKLPSVRMVYADVDDFGNKIEVNTVLLSNKSLLDSIRLEYQCEKVGRYSKDKGWYMEDCKMALIRNRFAF